MITIDEKTKKIAKYAGIIGIVLWVVLNTVTYFSSSPLGEKVETVLYLFFLLLIPACLAILASIKSSKPLLLVTIIVGMPFPLFALLTILMSL